jgi:hypothetical protein
MAMNVSASLGTNPVSVLPALPADEYVDHYRMRADGDGVFSLADCDDTDDDGHPRARLVAEIHVEGNAHALTPKEILGADIVFAFLRFAGVLS